MLRWPGPKKKKYIFDAVGYVPYPEQEPVHASAAELVQIVGAEGGGKSFVTAKEIFACIPFCELIYLVGQEYENTHMEFRYLEADGLEFGMLTQDRISTPKNAPWTFTTNTGCHVRTISVKKGATSIIGKGQEPDMIVLLEAGVIDSRSVLDAAMQRITRSAGRVIASGTNKDEIGWYAELEDILSIPDNDYGGETFSLPAWTNRKEYPGGETDPKILKLKTILPPDVFARTVAARRTVSLAAIFGDVFDPSVHVGDFPYQNGLPVMLWIDPGYYPSFYAVLAVQFHGDVAWVVDAVYEHHKAHEQIIEMCKDRPWWPAVRGAVGDVALKQHPADRSGQEVWLEKTGLAVQGQYLRIQDGIDRHRSILHQNRIGWNRSTTKKPVREYKLYRRRVDKENNPTSDTPIDAHCDCIVGDSQIDMPGGKQFIGDLVGQEPYVYCYIGGQVAVRKAHNIHRVGHDKIVKVLMDRGELLCTADHLLMLSDGTYCPASELRPGRRLMALNRFVTGRNGYTRIHMTGHSRESELEHRLVYEQVHGPIPAGYVVHHQDNCYWNHHPDNLQALSLEQHNTIHHRGKTLSREQRQAISKQFKTQWLENYEERVEIVRANVEKAHAANIGRSPTPETRTKISVAGKKLWESDEYREKMSKHPRPVHSVESREKCRQARLAYWQTEKGMAHRLRLAESNRQRAEKDNHVVIAVIPWGEADVYDMNVEEAHNFVANDVVIHNSMKAVAYGLTHKWGLSDRKPKPKVYHADPWRYAIRA